MELSPAAPWINVAGQLCENPYWDAKSQCLYWTDISAGFLYRHDWQLQETKRIYEGPLVGGFTMQEDGSLLLFRQHDIALLSPGDSMARRVRSFEHGGSTRFNDVIAAPGGRVFAGTIGSSSDSGGLFRVECDSTIQQVFGGTGCANGLGFSPALDILYWVCSTRRIIFAFPYTATTGALGEPKVFHQNTPEEGIPDGLTIDAEGNVYSIRWEAGTHALAIFHPDGKLLHQQAIPAKATTSLCFCGPDLRHLAITSAALDTNPASPSDLFLMESMSIPGREEYRSNLSARYMTLR
ncbi:SMP-30/gluconolactonase/LRE family protein [soil metagenome]